MSEDSRHIPARLAAATSVGFRSLHFDNLVVEYPMVQAALAGYSDWPMRVIASRLGAPFTLSEAMLPRFVLQVGRGKRAGRLLRPTGERALCGAQLMAGDDDELPAAAQRLAHAGFHAVDVNLACPVKKVLRRRRGGHLMGQPEAAVRAVARVRDGLPPDVPVTVKMRRGLDDSLESTEHFFAILDGVLRAGAAAVTVHGRTVRQRYEGRSSWPFLREVKHHAGSAVVLGSGDLFTARDCLAMIHQTGVDGVAVARGAIGNPWIFSQVRALALGEPCPEPSVSDQREVMLEHYRLAEETYGPQRTGPMMRKFGIWYARLHPRSEEVRLTFIRVGSQEDWHRAVAQWYR